MGVIQHFQQPVANQEIVLQFTSESFSDSETDTSLEVISKTLRSIGVDDISISSHDNQFYRIAYHSNESVSKIKQILSENAEINFNTSSEPSNENSGDFNLDVFKLGVNNSKTWDFEGLQVQSLNLKSDRSFYPDVYKFQIIEDDQVSFFDISVAYNCNKHIAFVSDNTSHNIPEVRAGPSS
ncbi:MAG: hypothetical protein ED556_13570 [Winogradskyella sp.]|uniref:hypothetical protein n=1 Tax=Winogradskyella sp. TaxID=1883156 RepID=UPI000F3C7286|nr:hypothetical protein [Winogradskyella sp.]RNC83576.1 MAG: hypothetical protein ED556_13570 [Winogradskyella sp.]